MLLSYTFLGAVVNWKRPCYNEYMKNPAGKSYIFLCLVIIGYIAGCLYKLTGKFDFVFFLYLLNGLLVATDTVLCLYYRRKNNRSKL